MSEMFYCPRAIEDGLGPNSPMKGPFNGEAVWRPDGTCSYCGSLSPARFFEAVEAGLAVTPTDKNYKAYVPDAPGGSPTGKFYFQHLSDEDKNRFIDLYNAKKMKIGIPGYFYVTPYFTRIEKAPG